MPAAPAQQLDPAATKFTRADFGPAAVESPIAIGLKAIDFYAPAAVSGAIADWTRFSLTQRQPEPAVYPGRLEEAVFTNTGAARMMAMGLSACREGVFHGSRFAIPSRWAPGIW